MNARATAAVALLAALCGSCAQNAFLELTLELPANAWKASGDRYANVRIIAGDADFDQDWEVDEPLPPFLLDPNAPTVQRVSVEAKEASEGKPVLAKIRFCRDPNCIALGDDVAPEVRLRIERAFYIGKRTSYTWSIPCVPNVSSQTPAPPMCEIANDAVTEVGKCGVAGCVGGSPREYCIGGQHYCERE